MMTDQLMREISKLKETNYVSHQVKETKYVSHQLKDSKYVSHQLKDSKYVRDECLIQLRQK